MGSPAVSKVYVELSVVLGMTMMPIRHLLKLGRGAVIELGTTADDPVSIYANGKLIAKGDVIAKGEVMVVVGHIGITTPLPRRSPSTRTKRPPPVAGPSSVSLC